MTTRQVSPPPSRLASASLVWFSTAASLILIAGFFLTGKGALVRVAIPAATAAVALTLYLRRPIGYMHFTLWTWFLAPFVRRLVDWRFGFEDHSLILVAPFLVSTIAGLTLLRERRLAGPIHLTSFFLCIAGVFYGFAVGVIRFTLHASDVSSLGEVVFGVFNWIAPILLGIHVYIRWPMYEAHKKAVRKSFVWAVLLLGLYGIYQYIAAPPWECAWLEGLPMGFENSSFGRPAPFEIRVWSTLNGPGPFATVILTGLILLFGARIRFKAIFAAAGYLSLLLSAVRTAWLAWFLAVILLLSRQRGAALQKFLFGLFILPLCLLPMLLNSEISRTVGDRFATMQSLESDGSFQDRLAMYEVVTKTLLEVPEGLGLRNSLTVRGYVLDSGLLQTVGMLGFTGAALYAAGLLFLLGSAIVSKKMQRVVDQDDAFRVIVLVTVVESIAGNYFTNVSGLMLWMFLGLWMAGQEQLEEVATSPLCLSGSRFSTMTPPTSGKVLA